MAVQSPITYDLPTLMRAIAEEVFGEDFFEYYAVLRTPAGEEPAFMGNGFKIYQGFSLNTNHLIFLWFNNHKVAVDTYGDIYIYREGRMTSFLAGFIADAKREIMSREEGPYVEATDHSMIPEFPVRMAI